MPSTSRDAAVCTIVTRNYLHFGLALLRSVRKCHPHLRMVICVLDRLADLPEVSDPYTSIIFADQLKIPGWHRYKFQYTAFELSCALKPTVMKYCLALPGVSRAVYLDADIRLFGRLDDFFHSTRDASIILTPHVLKPIPDDGKYPSRQTFALSGAYNGGFVAVNRTSTGQSFLDWWQAILAKNCIVNQPAGFFVDQKPLDLVPGLFDGVHILRWRGFHLAYWNLHGETLTAEPGGYRLQSGNKLVLFHFSGMDVNDPSTLSKHQDRVKLEDYPVVQELICQFIAELDRCDRARFEVLPYGYGALSDGTVILDAWRESVRTDQLALREVEDPFDTVRYPDLLQRFENPQRDPAELQEPEAPPVFSERLRSRWRRLISRERKAA